MLSFIEAIIKGQEYKYVPLRCATANEFVISSALCAILLEYDITELLATIIALLRPNYQMSYSGGAHKLMNGHHYYFNRALNS